MAARALLDADFLVALSKVDDSNHDRAIACARKLKSKEMVISPLTIPEASTVLSHRVSHVTAVKFLREMRRRGLPELELDIEVTQAADQIFSEQDQKGVSWPDCLNVALCRLHELEGIASFDRFYRVAGLKVLV